MLGFQRAFIIGGRPAVRRKSAADGYTLGVATTAGLASNAVIMKEKLGYNAERDIAYLYNMATQPNLLVAHPSVPAKTLPELIAWLKANPKTPYATSGIGSSQHIAARCWPNGRASRCRR